MRIIVRDGVRAVRHRAVAAEANVPLSATTYYFKDINDLITDTFAQYVERSAAQLGEFWERTLGLLPPAAERGSLASRRMLVDQVAKLAVDYVLTQLITRRDELVAEYTERFANPYIAAERGYIDEVIEPQVTRPRLIQALEMCVTKREVRPPRKHGNIPL